MKTDSSPPAPVMRHNERKEQAILTAAADVFLANGYEGSSMDEIAAQAGASKQTLYAHFGSKDGLFVAMARSLTDGAVTAHKTSVTLPDPQDDIAASLTAYGRQMLAIVLSDRLMRLRRLAIAEAERFPEFGAVVFRTGPGNSIDRLAAIVALWHDAGRLDAPDPAQAGALFNWMLMGGPTSEVMLMGDTAVTVPEAAERHVAECVRVFLAGYAA